MPELPMATPPSLLALATYLSPCVACVLGALVAWQGFRRLRQDALREAAFAMFAVAALQAILFGLSLSQAAPAVLLPGLDCISAIVLGWAFCGRARRAMLVGALSACGVVGAFTSSLWQLTGPVSWAALLWWLVTAALYGVATLALFTQRQDHPPVLLAALSLLAVSSFMGAAALWVGVAVLRTIAFPLVLLALVQRSTRDLESAQFELRSFSEHSLRQTQQLLALLRASTAFLAHADVARVLRQAADGITLGLGADSALAALLDDATQVLRVQAIQPPPSHSPTWTVPLSSQPAIAQAVQLGQQLALAPTHRGIHALAALLDTNPGPALVQPMLCQGRVLGVIVALNGATGRDFTESERGVMEAFGAQAAAAAENALLDQVVESQTREMAEMLNLREQEAGRRAAILQSIADGVIVFDHDQRAILANPAACRILDRAESQVLGAGLPGILDGQLTPEDRALIQLQVAGERPSLPGFKVAWGGKTIALSVAPVRLTSTGQHGAVVVLHDVTADAHVDRIKSEFVTAVSHELRTPFAALDSSMQIIRRYGLDRLLPEQREQLDQLAGELKRAQTMVNDLTTVAAFLSKRGQLRMALFDLGQLAGEVGRALEPMARSRDVTIALQIADALPTVYGDRERLSEAIYHLLHNAVKFNRPGGSVALACYSAAQGLVLQVTDTGVGIPPDKLPGLWKEFAQLADPLRRGVEGLGLGLPVVRYVVEAHGGQVWAHSQPGQGSVFGFHIPLVSFDDSQDQLPRPRTLAGLGPGDAIGQRGAHALV